MFKMNPFLLASNNGHLDIVKYLYPLTDHELYSKGIVYAALSGHLDIIKYLVSLGVNITDGALHWAKENNHR